MSDYEEPNQIRAINRLADSICMLAGAVCGIKEHPIEVLSMEDRKLLSILDARALARTTKLEVLSASSLPVK